MARCGAARAALWAVCAAAQVALAQAPGAAGDTPPRFEIRRFAFDGATLVPLERLEAATAAFTGPARSFADVQRALEAVARLYGEAGFSAVQVLLPEQELERGDIRLRIVEAKLGRVIVEGNRHFDEDNIRASVPSLAAGKAPNIRAIARDLRVANENPAKQATVLLRMGRAEAAVDAVVRVVDEEPARFSVTLDNSGTEDTGVPRLGLGYRNANFGGTDNVLALQYVGGMHEADDAAGASGVPGDRALILGASLRVPLYASGDALEFLGGYSNVNSGTAGDLYTITGAGGIFAARYLQNLDRVGAYGHRLAWAWDFRGYHNKDFKQTGSDSQLTPDIAVHPISLTYQGLWRRQASETSFSAGALRNIPGGPDGAPEDFCRLGPNPPQGSSRTDGMGNCPDPGYSAVRWAFNHSLALPRDWQLRFGMNGQYTRDMLVSGEQFGIGGADSVRGFEERAFADDKGYRGTLEVYTPDAGARTGWSGARLRALAFYDWGGVRRNYPVPPDPEAQHIASAGLGLRFSRGANLGLRMDYGWVLDAGGSPGAGGAAGSFQARGEGRLHAGVSYFF